MRELGLYELRSQRDREGEFFPGDSLLDVAFRGPWRYVGLLPRVREGATKEDVVPFGNVVWLDVDSRDALDHLAVFGKVGLAPNLVVDSGGGFWFYWKLNELVPTDVL